MKKLKFFCGIIVVLALICPSVSSSQVTYAIDPSAPYSYILGTNPITSWVSDYEPAADDGYFDLPLGDFVFQFYGVSVNTLRISTNGYMTFGPNGADWYNTPIPFSVPPNALIAPFWTDLDLSVGGQVRWGIFGDSPSRQLVIEWSEAPVYDFGGSYSFEAILYESTNEIKFQYLNVVSGIDADHGAWSTVGVENFDGTSGSEFSYNTALLTNGLAIGFIPGASETTPPVVSDFTIPETSNSLTVPITSFTATDNVGVTGYMITETAVAPSAGAAGWSPTAPTTYTFITEGTKTLYAWAKDAAGNVSTSLSASVTITLPVDTEPPVVTSFAIPATSSVLVVSISSFAATDDVGVSGYMVTESATAPLATATGWSVTPPTDYTFITEGTKTLYAWAKDAAGHVSTSLSASVIITLTDTIPPTVTGFSIPPISASLTVSITSFTATDDVGVEGYMVTESATAPSAGSADWSATAPVNYTFLTAGTKTLYAWAKDAAGHVSTSLSASVTITTLPTLTWLSIPGTILSSPGLAWNEGTRKIQMVVRGGGGSIWAGTFDSSATFMYDWAQIPGTILSTPALAWNYGAQKMQMVVRGGGDSIWAGTFDSTGTFMNDWVQIPGAIVDSPALAWNETAQKMQMVVRGGGDTIWASTFDSSGTFMNDWVQIPGAVLSTPGLAWNYGAQKMQMVVRGGGDSIWACTFDSSGTFMNDWVQIPGAILSAPALAWNEGAQKTQMVVRGGGDSIWEMLF